jgi:hypothetical protein
MDRWTTWHQSLDGLVMVELWWLFSSLDDVVGCGTNVTVAATYLKSGAGVGLTVCCGFKMSNSLTTSKNRTECEYTVHILLRCAQCNIKPATKGRFLYSFLLASYLVLFYISNTTSTYCAFFIRDAVSTNVSAYSTSTATLTSKLEIISYITATRLQNLKQNWPHHQPHFIEWYTGSIYKPLVDCHVVHPAQHVARV